MFSKTSISLWLTVKRWLSADLQVLVNPHLFVVSASWKIISVDSLTFWEPELNDDVTNVDEIRREVGMVFQQFNLFPHMTVLENCTLAQMLVRKKSRKEAETIAMEFLEKVRIPEQASKYPGELSGGQRKLLEVARGLMAKPRLLLLDEPAAGINPVLGKKIFQKLKDFSHNGIAFFIVEHRLEILFDFATWVYVMDKGRVVIAGEPQAIINDPTFYAVYLGEE